MNWSEVRIRKNPDVADGNVDDATILIAWMTKPVEAEVDAVLNRTGGAVWQMIDQVDSLSGIVEGLCLRFEVTASQAWTEVESLVINLANRGLLILEDLDGKTLAPPADGQGEAAVA